MKVAMRFIDLAEVIRSAEYGLLEHTQDAKVGRILDTVYAL